MAVPSRGLLGEAWDDFPEQYPNGVPIIFYRDPGQPSERAAGSALLLLEKTRDGRTSLVIREFNPLVEGIPDEEIGRLFESFVTYVEPRARRLGAELIQIPLLGFQNGPSDLEGLANYLRPTYWQGRSALPLQPAPSLKRSFADLSNQCVVVRDLSDPS